LVLVDRAEPALFEIDWELRRLWPELVIESHVVDCGSARMAALIARLSPRLVLHAAAHKHVPLMEANPIEAADNNVLATRRLLEACGAGGVERFVLVSTDKAVRPRSIMGASKRAAELVVQTNPSTTRAVAVRFGNVLGSTGSVIPIFRRQIEAGGPVTVTDPEMERYFMTIPEAAQLVLQAGAIGTGGEIFVLDMGKPVRIVDLARDMIRLAGLVPDQDVRIEISGVRPGEKIREELEHAAGELRATGIPKLAVTTASPPTSGAIAALVAGLEAAVASGDAAGVRELLEEAGRTA
jgi:FlaA1/EpsC-like NDP-sugar epimerase